MNTHPNSLETTARSLDDLAIVARKAESRAHRRTLVVTMSIAFAAIVAMSFWLVAVRGAAEKARAQAQIASEQAQIASEQAQIAERSYQLALTAATEQLGELQHAINNSGVTVAAARTLLAPMAATLAGLGKIQANPDTTKAQIRLLLTLSDIYSSLGNIAEALTRANQAKSLASHLASAKVPDATRLIFDATWRIGALLSDKGDLAAAVEQFNSALNIARQALAETPNDLNWQNSLSFVLIDIADNMFLMGRSDESVKFYQEAISVADAATRADPNNVSAQRNQGRALSRLGAVFFYRGDFNQALSSYRTALAILHQLTTKDPSNSASQLELARLYREIGTAQRVQQPNQAIESYQIALAILQDLVTRDPSNTVWETQLARTYIGLGDVLKTDSRYKEALEEYRTALRIQEALAAKRPDDAQLQRIIENLRHQLKTLDSEEKK
jgi:tetratricopeptide (TPR) repeat protein